MTQLESSVLFCLFINTFDWVRENIFLIKTSKFSKHLPHISMYNVQLNRRIVRKANGKILIILKDGILKTNVKI